MSCFLWSFVSAGLFWLFPTAWPALAADTPVDIGSRLEPLWDRYLIAEMKGTALKLHDANREEVVFRFDAAWEGGQSAYVTVLRDSERFRMYYRGGARPKILMAFGSPDGIHWTRLQEEPIITEGAFDSHNTACWDPARQQYVCFFRQTQKGEKSVARATSKDFLHWSKPDLLDFGETVRLRFVMKDADVYAIQFGQ